MACEIPAHAYQGTHMRDANRLLALVYHNRLQPLSPLSLDSVVINKMAACYMQVSSINFTETMVSSVIICRIY